MATKNKPLTKILIVLYYYHPYVSGVSVYAKRLAEGLSQAGYQVTVLTSHFDKNLPKVETINGVKVIRRPVMLRLSKGVIMPTFWLDIIRYSRHHDFVNPHLPMADSGLSSLFIAKRKMITTYQCDIFLGSGLIDRLLEAISMALMRVQLRRSKAIVTLANDYFEHSKMRHFSNKARQVYPPVPASEFQPLDPASLLKRLGLPAKTVKIGFVGRVVYEKGIQYLLEAIPYLQKELSDFKIIIVGEYEKVAGGGVKDQLDKYMEKYPDNILFTGFLGEHDLKQFYSALDVFVLPSIDPLEAFGIVQIEAMLCGSPVVASNLPGVREAVNKTGYGRISQIKDPKDIARQIIEVVSHPQKYRPHRQTVVSLFDPKDSIDAYTALMPKQ